MSCSKVCNENEQGLGSAGYEDEIVAFSIGVNGNSDLPIIYDKKSEVQG